MVSSPICKITFKKRLDLNLKQSDVAKIIDVTTDTVINWELNRSKPMLHLIPKVILFLGYPIDRYDNEVKSYRIQR